MDIEKYIFTYKNENRVPPRNSIVCDHWGFSNGNYSGNGIPEQYIEVGKYDNSTAGKYTMMIGDADKDASGADAGILESISYPTGRESIFHFEPHQYRHDYEIQALAEGREKSNSEPYYRTKNAGGLRIAKIEEYDPLTQKKLIKEYKYGKEKDGIGYVKHQPSMQDYVYEYNVAHVFGNNSSFITKVRMFLPESLREMSYNGSSTKYDYVTESSISESPNEIALKNGETVYKFKSDNQELGYVKGTTLNYNYDSEWATGCLLEKTGYNSDNSLVYHTTYVYGHLNTKSIAMKKVYKKVRIRFNYSNMTDLAYLGNYSGGAYTLLNYNIQSGWKRLESETTQLYNSDGSYGVSEEVAYSYENTAHPYPTRKVTKEDGDNIKTETFVYPQDIKYPNSAEQKLIGNNQLNSVIEKRVSFYGGKAWTNKTNYKLEHGNPVPEVISFGIANSEEERIKIHNYDIYGNPLYITKDDAEKSVYLWGYKGQYLVAKIEGENYNIVKNKLGETLINRVTDSIVPSDSDMLQINNLKQNLPNAFITTYTYKPLVGMTSVTDPRGVTTYYEYDDFGRLKATYIMENGEKKILQVYDYHYRE